MTLFITNTLTRKKEEFIPLNPPNVGLYSCGPTVYYYPQIGNWRYFVFVDTLKRVLTVDGYQVNHIMNATDVGHLTGDNIGQADFGEDRMEKASRREGKTVWEIAEFYLKDFVDSRQLLRILPPNHFVRATDHINEQIELIKKLEEKELTYKTKLGVYFNVSKYPDYGKLGGQKMIDKRIATRDELKEDPEKKSPFDFALWKFSLPNEKRLMEWDSPWGVGYPGWHIECSAMSMKYLGETFDIHTGGIDHIAIHHANEIAQSEGATGKLFAKYWMHQEFLKVDGGRMGKSLGNAYTLHDIEGRGFKPLALRYLYLTAHYRDTLNFTWDSLKGAQNALNNLYEQVAAAKSQNSRTVLSNEKNEKREGMNNEFISAINDDLNTPKALALLWKVLKSNIPSEDKYDLALSFDEVLGLGLSNIQTRENKTIENEFGTIIVSGSLNLSGETISRINDRNKYRTQKSFEEADKVRLEIEKNDKLGLKDTALGTLVYPLKDKN